MFIEKDTSKQLLRALERVSSLEEGRGGGDGGRERGREGGSMGTLVGKGEAVADTHKVLTKNCGVCPSLPQKLPSFVEPRLSTSVRHVKSCDTCTPQLLSICGVI